MKKITIIARDEENKIEKIIEEIRKRGNCGHSFNIIVEDKAFFWDGDGSDRINSIQEEEFFTSYELKDMIRLNTNRLQEGYKKEVQQESASFIPDCDTCEKSNEDKSD